MVFKKGYTPWNKGKVGISESTRDKKSKAMLGNKHLLGFHHTEFSKIKIGLKSIGRIPPNKGQTMKEETKRLISKKLKGRIISEAHRMNLSLALKGKTHTLAENKKTSIALKLAYKNNPELKLAISKRMKGKQSPMQGKHHTDEAKAIIRECAIKQFQDPKQRELCRLNRRKIIVPSKDSKPERMMQLALTLHKIPFEKHKPLIGQPDIFIQPNICIFVDGDYWHANPEKYNSEKLIFGKFKAKDIWAKDLRIHHELNQLGYQVIRIWETDIKKNVNDCAKNIIKLIQELRGVSQ